MTGTLYTIFTRKGRTIPVLEMNYFYALVKVHRILRRLDPDDDIREINWR